MTCTGGSSAVNGVTNQIMFDLEAVDKHAVISDRMMASKLFDVHLFFRRNGKVTSTRWNSKTAPRMTIRLSWKLCLRKMT